MPEPDPDDAIGPAISAHQIMEGIAADRGGEMHIPTRPSRFSGLLGRWHNELDARLLARLARPKSR